jgi:predicted RNA binding protein YcfA (HicA-like mRNA interferase family)
MRVPRDLSADDLVHLLKSLGYVPVRQTGSHIRLVTQQHGEHHITIPRHDPLRMGTLSGLLSDISDHFGIGKDALLGQLFGR